MKCCLGSDGKIVSPSDFVSVVWTQARIPYSFPKQMVVHYNKVELSKTLENTVELEGQMFLVIPRSRNTYLVAYSDFRSYFSICFPVFILYYEFLV